jgi:hypothetical protein
MKRVRIAIVVVGMCLAGVIGWQVVKPSEPEPVYEGKRLSKWLEEGLPRPGEPWQWAWETDQAVLHIGTNAIPTLLRLLRVKDSPFKARVLALVGSQRIFKVMPAGDWNLAAAEGFNTLGASAYGAVPALIGIVDENISSESRMYAVTALGHVGPSRGQAVPHLLQWATNADAALRARARDALGRIDPESAAAAGLTNGP